MKIIKPIWIALHVVLIGLLWHAVVQDAVSKGDVAPSSAGQSGMLLVFSFAIVVFILAVLKRVAELLFPALRRLQGLETIRHQR
ncbi:hypothetical protein [Tardiphaga sp. 803_E3_N1_3]|uniref:hypothetical protein n=1 Tax=Tardiphaga sp. 803_E3_N1_3 TaxID=3240785 RepID=UPI003F26A925